MYSNNVFELITMDAIYRVTDSFGQTVSQTVATFGEYEKGLRHISNNAHTAILSVQ